MDLEDRSLVSFPSHECVYVGCRKRERSGFREEVTQRIPDHAWKLAIFTEGFRRAHAMLHPKLEMVLQILADASQLVRNRDTHGVQNIASTDPRQLQKGSRIVCASR